MYATLHNTNADELCRWKLTHARAPELIVWDNGDGNKRYFAPNPRGANKEIETEGENVDYYECDNIAEIGKI